MSSPLRHATVALSVVVALSCAGFAGAQTVSRPEVLLKKMTLDEKLGQLVQRADDNEEVVRTRLDVYNRQTRPLVEYYRSRPTFSVVNGAQSPDQVAREIAAKVDGKAGARMGSVARASMGTHP